MPESNDISSLSDGQLLELWARTEKELPAVKHGGRQNRLARRCRKIIDLLKARTDGTAHFLKPLLSDPDLRLRLTAATLYKAVDHAAYLAVAGELAQRQDEIGRAARESLARDASSAQYATSGRTPEQLQRLAEAAKRRVSRPQPAGISRVALEQRLRAEFPADLASRLLGLARPAIGLWPQRLAAEAPPTASRFGGMPCAPAGWSWPACEGEPLFFLAQISCRELAHLSAAAPLPRDGMLGFFGDHDWVNGFPNLWPYAAIEYWPEASNLRLAACPIDEFEVMPACALRFFETIDLPDPRSEAIERLPLAQATLDRYWDLHGALAAEAYGLDRLSGIDVNKMFGWPDLVQRDIECFEEEDRKDWHLLLQMGDYETGSESHSWGPGGNLYFLIREANLAVRDFDLCDFEMQSS
jgi:uncharacterized protein YwqG